MTTLTGVLAVVGALALTIAGAIVVTFVECQLDPLRTGTAPTRRRVLLMGLLGAAATAALLAWIAWAAWWIRGGWAV